MVYDFAAKSLGELFVEHVFYYVGCLRTGRVEENGIGFLFAETKVSGRIWLEGYS